MSAYGRVRLEHAEVTGERVRLRPISVEDAAACFELVHDEPLITDWILWDGPDRIEELEERYASWSLDREDETHYVFAILECASGEWAGSIGLHHRSDGPVATLGYLVGVPYQGRGLGTEAVQHVVELAFRGLEVLLVRAEVFVGNVPSIHVLESTGLRLDEGVLTTREKQERTIETHSYSISRADWEAGTSPAAEWAVRSSREE